MNYLRFPQFRGNHDQETWKPQFRGNHDQETWKC